MLPHGVGNRNQGDRSMTTTPIRPASDRDPIGPFLHYLMAECGVSPHTLAAYRSDLMRFIRWRKSEAPGPLASLDAPALGGYVDSLHRDGLAPSSVCRHLASLSTFFRFLVFDGRLQENVAKLLVAPAVWDRLPTVLEPRRDRLVCSKRPAPSRGWAVATAPPWRPCTRPAAAPRRSSGSGRVDLDLKAGTARCVGKGNKERQVPLGSRCHPGTGRLSRTRSPGPGGTQPPDRRRVRLEVRPSVVADRPLADRQTPCPIGRLERRGQPTYPQAQLRHPPSRPRRRSARRPGNARPRLDRHDPDLYTRRAEPAPRRSRPVSSP